MQLEWLSQMNHFGKKTPLFKPSGLDTLATQYNGKYIEDVDLIKFDFLGLKTLTVIDEALKLIEQKTW